MEGLDAMEGLAPLLKARLLADAIASCLPADIPVAALPLHSKIPFKIVSLREMLFHRISALASPAVSLLEAGNLVSGILLTRAVMETAAIVVVLGYELKRFAKKPDIERLDGFLMKCLFANRKIIDGVKDEYEAENIMNFIDAVTKKNNGFRTTYETLCEYAHPNYDGVFGSFGTVDEARFVIELGPRIKGNGGTVGAEALAKSLDILVRNYDDMVPFMNAATQHFEPHWRERPDG